MIERVIERFRNDVGGFVTKEVREDGERRGFEIVTTDGRRAMLADRDLKSEIRVGKYGVDVENLDKIGVSAIERALLEKKIVVIDEIGNMEIASARFRDAALRSLDSDCPVLGTIHVHNNEFTDAIKRRSDVYLLHLTVENREEIQGKIIAQIRNFLEKRYDQRSGA